MTVMEQSSNDKYVIHSTYQYRTGNSASPFLIKVVSVEPCSLWTTVEVWNPGYGWSSTCAVAQAMARPQALLVSILWLETRLWLKPTL